MFAFLLTIIIIFVIIKMYCENKIRGNVMKEDKMHLINKIFNNETIRTVWDKEAEKYYIRSEMKWGKNINPFKVCFNLLKYVLSFFKLLLTKKRFNPWLNFAFSKVIPLFGRMK